MADSAGITTPAASNDVRGHIARVLEIATILHRQGRLHQSEQLYRRILAIGPNHFGALCGLGMLCGQSGRRDDAVWMLRHAAIVAGGSADAQMHLGTIFAALDHSAEAIAHYENALAIDPRHAGAHNNIGVVLQRLGRLEDAVAHFEQALAIAPDLAEARGSLGNALRALGRRDEAVAQYEQALAIRPGHADLHNNLAGVLQMLGRSEEAIAHYEQALALKPDYAEAHFNLGNALQDLGRHVEAMARYERAIALKPDFAAAHNNLGNGLQKLGRFEQAIVHYRRALAIQPGYGDAHHNLGNALLALDCNEEAIAHYEQAIAVDSAKAELHNNMGTALHEIGRLEEAYRAYEKAVELAPRAAAIHLNLASLRPFTAGDPRLATLEKLFEDVGSLGVDDQIGLHFALGKAFADLEQPERSFRHLSAGNALKRRQIAYDESETLRTFERIRATFTPRLLQQKPGGGDDSPVPVFVVGMPRSGTTLVEQVLASHSRVFGAGEREDFREAVSALKGPNDTPAFPELAAAMSGEDLRRLGSHYVGRVSATSPEAARIVDKMPINFLYLGLIHMALPRARVIHVRRDPVDTCLSCFSLLFTGDLPHTYDLGELGRYYGAYAALMEHWRSVLPPGVMLEVRYEDVVDDLETQARRLVAHCGLDWEDACLAFHQTQRPVHTASVTQVRQPIYRSSVGRWRPYGHLLQPLLQALGAAAVDTAPSQ